MDFLSHQENRNNIESLIQNINQDECCVFIGAGLSIPAGYPSWEYLLSNLRRAAEEKTGTDSFELSRSKWGEAEQYRRIIDEPQYSQLVTSHFLPDGKDKFRSVHQVILDTPFHAYITTNYDCCLENAATFLRKQTTIHYYPELDPSFLRKSHIFHIHGFINPENPNETIGTIVLTERDYARAYRPTTVLPTFLASLFFFHTIVFIGYGLNDEDLTKIYQTTKLELELQKEFEKEENIGTRKLNRHNIFLHNENSNRLQTIREMELLPIFYGGETIRHSGLEEILRYIHIHTTKLDYPQLDIHQNMFEVENNG